MLGKIWDSIAPYLPICFQESTYRKAKKKLLARKIHPLLDYPLYAYITCSLDEEFKKFGMRRAIADMEKWITNYAKKVDLSLANAKAGLKLQANNES